MHQAYTKYTSNSGHCILYDWYHKPASVTEQGMYFLREDPVRAIKLPLSLCTLNCSNGMFHDHTHAKQRHS